MAKAHPTISAWTRDEHEGFYSAEMHGHKLKVVWTPNRPGVRGSFYWEAEAGGVRRRSDETFEELELAMAQAEAYARLQAAQRTAELNAKATGSTG